MNGQGHSRLKRESILGLPVIDGKTGKKLGIVKDVYANEQGSYLEGFYVTNKGWGNKAIGISFDDATVGEDAIVLEGEHAKQHKLQAMQTNGPSRLLNKKVIREDGVELGEISDIILDPLSGRIEGLELSESMIGDLLSGRQILPYEPYEYADGDRLIITLEQAENIISCNRGIKNILFNKLE